MNKISLYPADIYQVIDKSLLSDMDRLILNMLYMPIIGSNAISLYFKLQAEAKGTFMSVELTHHHLMTSVLSTLDNLKESRIRLEGIGLLKTYVSKGDVNSYIYELYSPVSAEEFFHHPIFNMVLYNNVGKSEYERLLRYFKLPSVQLKDYEDITMSFDSVFKIRNYTPIESASGDIVSKNKLLLQYELDYDYDLLISLLPHNMFNEKCLNKSMRELITNLSFLYELDPYVMADLIVASLNEKGNIVKEDLRKNTRKFYQFNNDNRLPSLIFKSQVEYLKSASGDNSKRGRIIRVFENNSPYEFLKAKYKGAKPTDRDMQILEMLLIDLKLNPAVCNVLIDYVLKTNNNKLVKSYIEVIAGQWKRSGVETASEAMSLAEKEHKKKFKKGEITSKKASIMPSWFNESIEKNNDENVDDLEFKNMVEEFRKYDKK